MLGPIQKLGVVAGFICGMCLVALIPDTYFQKDVTVLLHKAVRSGDVTGTIKALSQGADPDEKNVDGKNAVQLAYDKKDIEILKVIAQWCCNARKKIQKTYNCNAQNKSERTCNYSKSQGGRCGV